MSFASRLHWTSDIRPSQRCRRKFCAIDGHSKLVFDGRLIKSVRTVLFCAYGKHRLNFSLSSKKVNLHHPLDPCYLHFLSNLLLWTVTLSLAIYDNYSPVLKIDMASHSLAIAKASLAAGMIRPDPISIPRTEIAHFHELLEAVLRQCSSTNIQVWRLHLSWNDEKAKRRNEDSNVKIGCWRTYCQQHHELQRLESIWWRSLDHSNKAPKKQSLK